MCGGDGCGDHGLIPHPLLTLHLLSKQLCAPFTKLADPKFEKINALYLAHPSCKIDISQESRLGISAADMESVSDEIKAQALSSGDPNFISEAFFFTLHAFHNGVIPAAQKYTNEWASSRSALV